MTGSSPRRRGPPPLAVWLLVALLLFAASASVALGLLAWQEARQVEALRAELASLRSERQVVQDRLLTLESTAIELEDRLTNLESKDPAERLAKLETMLETGSDANRTADLRATLAEIQEQVYQLQAALESLSTRMQASDTETRFPPEARLSVSPQQQSHNLSCESSAASMAAQYHGVDLRESEVLAALPLHDNPHRGFRGNVDGPLGGTQDYGVYAGPILEILNAQGLRAWLVEGGLDGIKAAIARRNPVLVWVTYDCQLSTPTTETIDGEAVILVPWQHVVVVTGYSPEGVWANDPWDGQEEFYSTADFEMAMGYFGDMAIEVAAP